MSLRGTVKESVALLTITCASAFQVSFTPFLVSLWFGFILSEAELNRAGGKKKARSYLNEVFPEAI